MTDHQKYIKLKVELLAPELGVDISWALAIAEQESSLGENQLSPTGCRGCIRCPGSP